MSIPTTRTEPMSARGDAEPFCLMRTERKCTLRREALLTEDHPPHAHLREVGPGLHPLCFAVENVEEAAAQMGEKGFEIAPPHQGTQSKRAAFIARASTDGVQMEL